jgi:hypothetical protein
MNILLCTYAFQQHAIYSFSHPGMLRSELNTLDRVVVLFSAKFMCVRIEFDHPGSFGCGLGPEVCRAAELHCNKEFEREQ